MGRHAHFGGNVRGCALIAICASALAAPLSHTGSPGPRTLSLEDRVTAQDAIERVYFRHLRGSTRSFEDAVPHEILERKAVTYLKETAALERYWQVKVTPQMLHYELERMLRYSRIPDRLAEIFTALDDDTVLIQECLVRPLLVERLARERFAQDATIHAGERAEAERMREALVRGEIDPFKDQPFRRVVELVQLDPQSGEAGVLPTVHPPGPLANVRKVTVRPEEFAAVSRRLTGPIGEVGPLLETPEGFIALVLLAKQPGMLRVARFAVDKTSWNQWWGSVEDTLDPLSVRTVAADDGWPPAIRAHPGGTSLFQPGAIEVNSRTAVNCGGCAPDTWVSPTLTGAPSPRHNHSAVWTGSEVIVWGGEFVEPWGDIYYELNTGGRYDPATDTWMPTSTTDAPSPRNAHTAVWTGSQMIVWGGDGVGSTGARYDPLTDTWTPTSTTHAPAPRYFHTAVWTGSLMIVFAGFDSWPDLGGRYDPVADVWTPLSTTDAPIDRYWHTAVWTGEEMIVWGGQDYLSPFPDLSTGGRYNPNTDTWRKTSTTGAPTPRSKHTAVWTGNRMVIWGGNAGDGFVNSGGLYDPASDSWAATSLIDAPPAWNEPVAVWTGASMIIWAGAPVPGGLYDPMVDSWAPISTVGAPSVRSWFPAVWTGGQMMVWGGRSSQDLNDGGLYCPCTPVRFYADADGDGHGDAARSSLLCSPSTGYVVSGDDCGDTDATIWMTPGEVGELLFLDTDRIHWRPPAEPGGMSPSYDVIRSDSPDDFVGAAVCVSSNTPLTDATDSENPATGHAFHYLIRAENGCPSGEGSLGTGSAGLPRPGRHCP